MCQNIDKQQNMSLGFYNSFQDNAPIFIRKKKNLSIHLYAGFGGLQSAVKGLSRNFLVPRRGINRAARPQEAESTLGRRPQAAASPSARLPLRSWAGGPASTRSLVPGVSAPRKAFLRGPDTESSRGAGSRRAAAPTRRGEGGGTWGARGSRGWGRGRSLRP